MLHQVCSQDRDGSRNQTIDECATVIRHVVILTATEGVTLGNKVMFRDMGGQKKYREMGG